MPTSTVADLMKIASYAQRIPQIMNLINQGSIAASAAPGLAGTTAGGATGAALAPGASGLGISAGSLAGPMAVLTVPLLMGALNARSPKELHMRNQFERAKRGYEVDALNRLRSIATGRMKFTDPAVRTDLGLLRAQAENARDLGYYAANAYTEMTPESARELEKPKQEWEDKLGRFIYAMDRLGVTPIKKVDVGQGLDSDYGKRGTGRRGGITLDLSLADPYAELLAPLMQGYKSSPRGLSVDDLRMLSAGAHVDPNASSASE